MHENTHADEDGHSVKSYVRLSTVQKEAKEITGRYKQTAVGSKLRHGFANFDLNV